MFLRARRGLLARYITVGSAYAADTKPRGPIMPSSHFTQILWALKGKTTASRGPYGLFFSTPAFYSHLFPSKLKSF